jgi:hypothetical protein
MHIPRVRGKFLARLLPPLLVVLSSVAPTLQAQAAPLPTTTLHTAFHASAMRYQEPEDLLLAISWVNTHWEMQQSADNGFGMMHLVKDPKHDSVAAAAKLTGHSEQELETDPTANVEGGAALLAQAQGSARPASLTGWLSALVQIGGTLFAAQVFDALKSGASRTTSQGEQVVLAPHPEVPTSATSTVLFPATANPPAAPNAVAVGGAAATPSAQAGAGADYSGAIWNPASPSNFTANDRPPFYPVQMIVIHVSQGSYSGTISYFQDPASQASAHYVTKSSDGEITQMVHDHDIAWHAGNWDYNTRSIGIEHEGFVNDPSWFTDAMYRHSAQLTAYATVKFGIPIDRLHIIGHSEVPDPNNPALFGGAGHHTDPGPYWNWSLYLSYVRQYAGLISCGGSIWTMYPGAANDLSVGANGATWIVGTNLVTGGFGIFNWTASGWSSVAGGAVRIAVDPSGQPWVLNSGGEIWRRSAGGGWQMLPGAGSDIGIGADGSVWLTGTNAGPGGYGIFRWNGSGWSAVGGGAVRISVGAKGAAWVVNDGGYIFEWTAAGWVSHPGLAHDIGVGADNTVWVTGSDAVSGGYDIFHWTGSDWGWTAGGATNIAVGPTGIPWIANSVGAIFTGRQGTWQAKPGTALDVAVGADGSIWITGSNPVPGGYPLFKWNGSGWSSADGGAIDISVGPTGAPWVVRADGSIAKWLGSSWQVLPGSANDIAIGANGSVWIIGATAVPGGYDIENWTGTAWTTVPGAGVHIAVAPNGLPWVVNDKGEIWQRTAPGGWQQVPGQNIHDVGIGADGTAWTTGGGASCGGFGVARWNGTGWDQYDGSGFQIAVGPNGMPWLVNGAGTIFARG